jgi:hypothetical protein
MLARALLAETRILLGYRQNKRVSILPHSFYDRNIDKCEPDLHDDCTDFMHTLGWKRVAHEWPVVPHMERCGRGDMVFHKGNVYFVMEAKRRNNKKVQDQALYYAASWKLQNTKKNEHVIYGIWTIRAQDILGVIRCKRVAADICWPRFIRKDMEM